MPFIVYIRYIHFVRTVKKYNTHWMIYLAYGGIK